ncbi:MAG TPA: hypothetical protein VGW38_27260, partial [Chloroflexota bacterium]|nr:hypothetical protein [Chloroflexota bacterium]
VLDTALAMTSGTPRGHIGGQRHGARRHAWPPRRSTGREIIERPVGGRREAAAKARTPHPVSGQGAVDALHAV